MSTTELQTETAYESSRACRLDMKLEVVVLPVADVERAKRFYVTRLGWRLDGDFVKGDFRGIQCTPPGSPCSIIFGTGVTPAAPGSVQGLFLVVSDIVEARAELVNRGIEVGQVFHRGVGEAPKNGPDPERRSYFSYAAFNDPDGNGWLLQEVTVRLPGRVDPGVTTFASAAQLAAAMSRAAAAHGEHEKRVGKHDTTGWPNWYAEYIAAEQAGKPLPT
jgi:catechol 2,3-dioxygenase-like lactoylglutathione lyase family enzyme